MQLPDIERLCDSAVPGSGSIDLEALGVGLISETYRVARDGVAYALKVPAERRELHGDMFWEVRVLELAGVAGLAPRLVYSDPEGAVLLTRWAKGRCWPASQAGAPATLRETAALLRRVHALAVPRPARQVTPQQWITIYDEALARRNSTSRDEVLHRAALIRAQSLTTLPRVVGVLCHSDLHALNVIQEGDSLILLDWEYAHVADPLWDLAGWCANNDFKTETQWSLLTDYLGDAPASSQWQRLRLLLALYDYVCLLWSRLYLDVLGEAAIGVAERARLLDGRLRHPAHYAA